MLIGYARTSTSSQDHSIQMDALEKGGCERIFVETALGMKADRPELAKALETAERACIVREQLTERAKPYQRSMIT